MRTIDTVDAVDAVDAVVRLQGLRLRTTHMQDEARIRWQPHPRRPRLLSTTRRLRRPRPREQMHNVEMRRVHECRGVYQIAHTWIE